MKNTTLFFLLLILIVSCEKDRLPQELSNVMVLKVENNNADSDNFSKVKLIAEFPEEFSTEEDNKVDFYIMKDDEEKLIGDIRLVEQNGVLKRVAEVFVKYNKAETLVVKAVIKIDGVEFSKSTTIDFEKAYLENIIISSSSLEVNNQSFETITLTTQLSREKGFVTLNTIANTKAYDNMGNPIGAFLDYKNKTDENGRITNLFTLGNSNYVGPITIVSETLGSDNLPFPPFTLTLYSN